MDSDSENPEDFDSFRSDVNDGGDDDFDGYDNDADADVDADDFSVDKNGWCQYFKTFFLSS
jgi:hypothetical protein